MGFDCDKLQEASTLPGMTRYIDKAPVQPFTKLCSLSNIIQRKVVLLATAVITEDNLFNNGLFQNVYVLYRMFESMGWLPIMIVNKKPESTDKIPWYMKDIRLISIEETGKNPIPVKLYIEIGMSIDANMRKFLKMCGARIAKLYLGNILNIDVETPIFFPNMNFAHHVIGELDDIWVSPHYPQNAEYARALNHTDLDKPEPIGRQANSAEEERFLILEPNISFQKSSLIPLMIMEAWFRKNPSWPGEVVIINGERLLSIPFFKETVWDSLDIVKAGRVKMRGRMDILSVLNEFPSGMPICHQINNEYNYMVLEYFWSGYPVLHNSSDWKEFGYYYENSDISTGADMVEKIRKAHQENTHVYKSHAKALAWRHSPYNPDVHKAWDKILESRG